MRGFINEQSIEFHETLKMMAIQLLLSIMEGPPNEEIYQEIADSFDDFKILQMRLTEIYTKFVEEELNLSINTATPKKIKDLLSKDSFQGGIKEGFDIYCILNLLAITCEKVDDKIRDFADTPIYKFFRKNTGNVEILKDGDIMCLYFPVHPICDHLTPGTISNFDEKVNRKSITNKILDLCKMTP